MSEIERAPRLAVVPPYAAQWLLSQLLRAGMGSRQFREQAAFLRSMGYGDLAGEVEVAVGQLRAAAQWHRARAEGPVSDDGSGQAEVREGGASSASGEVPTKEAAEMLGVSARRVGQLLSAGVLRGRRVGRSWLVEEQSLSAVASARSAGRSA